MKKTIVFLTIIITTIFTAYGALADTSGDVNTNPSFEWGDVTVGNGGYSNINASGGYDLVGADAEGYANIEGFAYGETSIGTTPNQDGFMSNSSFGYAEVSGTAQAMSGSGTLDLSATGNLGNWSQIGSDQNNFGSAYHETTLTAFSQETQSDTLSGDARIFGYAYSSEKDGIEIGGFYSELTGSIPGSALVNGGVETSSSQSVAGITSQSTTSTITGLEINNGQFAQGFGESQSIATYGDTGAYGAAMAHSYSGTGTIPETTP